MLCYRTVVADDSDRLGDVSDAIRAELPIDDPWRIACKARLRALGLKQHHLAEHVGCSQGNISQALSTDVAQQTSEFAHAISLALSVPLGLGARWELVRVLLEREGPKPDAVEQMFGLVEPVMGIPVIKPPKSGT